MRLLRLAPTTVLVALLPHCASSNTSGPEPADASSSADTSTMLDGSPSGPVSPTLLSVSPMHGGLHVYWRNEVATCDSVEGERKGGPNADFVAAFSVPGEVDNKHDVPPASGTYTYRLRCKQAGVYSAYSNEVSGAP